MADLYYVGAGANWNSASWATSSGGAATNTPTSADNCILDANSGNITINTGSVARSWTVNGYTGTVTHNNATTLTLGDATAGLSNYILNFVTTGWTYTLNTGTATVTLNTTSATQQSVFTNGKVLAALINSGAGNILISGNLTTNGSITHTAGALDLGSGVINSSTFVMSGSNVKSLTGSGESILNVTSGTFWNMTATNSTLSLLNHTISLGTITTNTRTFAGANLSYGTVKYTVADSPGIMAVTGSNSFETLVVDAGRIIQFASGANNTVNNWQLTAGARGYVYTPGNVANMTVPDTAAVSTTGDFDVRMRIALDNWGAANIRLTSKSGASPNLSWTWRISGRTFSIETSTNGTSLATGVSASTTMPDPGAGVPVWIRMTRRSSDGRVQWFYAADNASMPSSWTQVGTDRTAQAGALFDSAAELYMDGLGGGAGWAGKMYRYQLRDNVLDDGTGIVLDANFAAKTWGANSFTESSSNAATVTIGNNLTQMGDGRIRIQTSSAGSQSTLKINNPNNIELTHLEVQDIRIGTPYKLFITSPYTDGGNNTNVNFTAPPNAPRIRQSAFINNSAATSGSLNFDAPTTAGRLLVLMLGFAADPGTVTAPSGYTLSNDNPSANGGVYMFHKIADGTETSVSASWINSVGSQFFAYELGGWVGVPTLDTIEDNNSASATSLSSGSGITPTGVPAFALVAVAANGGMGASTTPPTNSFQEDYNTLQLTGSFLKVSAKPLTSASSESTTMSWTTSRIPRSVAVIFKDVQSSFKPRVIFM